MSATADDNTDRGPRKAHHREKAHADSFLETVESLVVALVLAFVFRAFIVEAFVIPTGSMAPGLLGRHFEYTCANCGYEYDIGLRERAIPPFVPMTVCPNCFSHRVEDRQADLMWGDRILVVKYMYDLFPPERWDVVVFKFPWQPENNYIKRLIGLPGERIELRDGDVYANGEIQRKPDKAQSSLWMIVHDTDHWDAEHADRPRWRPAADEAAFWTYRGMPIEVDPPAGRMTWLAYHHVNWQGHPSPIHDFYAYDNPVGESGQASGRPDPENIVTDLRLLAELVLAEAGRAELVLTADDDAFHFELPFGPGGEPLRIRHNGATVAEASAEWSLPVGRAVRVEAANVDNKLLLKVDGKRVIDLDGDGTLDRTDDYRYDPGPEAKRSAELTLGIAGSPATVRRLRVDRDVYYTAARFPGRVPYAGEPGFGVEGGAPVVLQEGQYFVLGDNSPQSADSRIWSDENDPSRYGPIVPEANLVGKAFFVYWPAAGSRYGIPWPVVPEMTEFRLIE